MDKIVKEFVKKEIDEDLRFDEDTEKKEFFKDEIDFDEKINKGVSLKAEEAEIVEEISAEEEKVQEEQNEDVDSEKVAEVDKTEDDIDGSKTVLDSTTYYDDGTVLDDFCK